MFNVHASGRTAVLLVQPVPLCKMIIERTVGCSRIQYLFAHTSYLGENLVFWN